MTLWLRMRTHFSDFFFGFSVSTEPILKLEKDLQQALSAVNLLIRWLPDGLRPQDNKLNFSLLQRKDSLYFCQRLIFAFVALATIGNPWTINRVLRDVICFSICNEIFVICYSTFLQFFQCHQFLIVLPDTLSLSFSLLFRIQKKRPGKSALQPTTLPLLVLLAKHWLPYFM